jgi:hypothetical protein
VGDVDAAQGSHRQLKRSLAARHVDAPPQLEEGVACSLCAPSDPSDSLQSKLHQYPARTLNQIVLPLQSTIHNRNYSCSPRRRVQRALHYSHQHLHTRITPGHNSLMLRARSLVSPVATALAKEAASRVASSEPTTANCAETVAVRVQHTIDALVADQPLRFQSPGWCPALSSAVYSVYLYPAR